jgi:uncharacterized protein (TIGR00266 family)
MQYEIFGEFAQFARLTLTEGERCWASKGGIMSYTDGIDWRLRVPGGVAGAARRVVSGEGIALTHIEATRTGGSVSLTSGQPGRIFVWDLADGSVVTTRGSFLAGWGDIDISVTVARRAGAAIFGGAGLFLQRVAGRGIVLVHASGYLDDRRLAPGEVLTVSTGHLAAFADSVDYDIRYVGGMRKALFGGEGLFMTRLVGPGRVLLQTVKRRREVRVEAG